MAQPRTVLDNIQAVIQLEDSKEQQRRFSDRVADAIATFAGTVVFVLLHLLWFGLWAAINLGVIKLAPAFDPYPFQLLCMLVSLEGVLLSTFVLIKQNRMSYRADRRAHLDLQVNLLTEKEVTKVIQMLEGMSRHLGVGVDGEARELGEVTAVADLARELDQKLPEDV